MIPPALILVVMQGSADSFSVDGKLVRDRSATLRSSDWQPDNLDGGRIPRKLPSVHCDASVSRASTLPGSMPWAITVTARAKNCAGLGRASIHNLQRTSFSHSLRPQDSTEVFDSSTLCRRAVPFILCGAIKAQWARGCTHYF